jgi:MFS family permease
MQPPQSSGPTPGGSRDAEASAPIQHASPFRNPWWIPPFLGGVPPIDPQMLRLLGMVTLGMLFEQYDLSLLSAAIKHINEDLNIELAESGFYLGAIRLGGLLTFAILPFADRLGRRRLFLASLLGMSIGTLATGFAQSPLQFVVAQVVARAFMLSAVAVAIVIVIEEFPAAHRGWGIGVMGAVGGMGFGLGAMLFAAIDVLPYGWRALYVFGITPVLLLPFFRRELSETARFQAHQQARGGEAGEFALWQPIVELLKRQPRRALALGLTGLLGAFGAIAVFQYASLFVQEVHDFEPWEYSVMILIGGGVGIVGNIVAGRLGDRIGRRFVGVLAYGMFPVSALLFYYGPSSLLWIAFAGIVFFNSAGEVVTRALSGELFETGHRGTSSGWLMLVQALGWSIGLFAVGAGTAGIEDLVGVISALSVAVGVGGICLLLLPETRRRELEEISAQG